MGEILMAERAKDQKAKEGALLDGLIKKHEELIPTVMKTQVMVDLYWKGYAYGDELKPHIEFLDGIMLSSTRDIAPSCVENVDELIERQEKSLVQLETKRGVVKDLIEKGKKILENPDKPKFLEGNVKKIQEGWEETKEKAAGRLKLLQDTKETWIGYAENSETIASDFEYCEEEIKKVKKKYNLQAAQDDLKKRQDLYNAAQKKIDNLFKSINDNFTCMSITLPEDKKKKMTTHAEADAEVAALKERYQKVKKVSEEWVKKVDTLLKEWVLLDNTVTELNSWVAKDKTSEGENQFSLEKMESTLGELKNIFKEKEKLVEGL